MAQIFAWTDGRLLQHDGLAEGPTSLPVGTYTTLRTYGHHRVVRLGRHVERLQESARLQGLPDPPGESSIRAALRAALRAAGHPESRARLTWAPPTLFVAVEAFPPLPDSFYRDGVACATLSGHRENPHAKDTRFIAQAAESGRGLPPGVHEGLLVDQDGAVLEGLSSNFFAVAGGLLRTEEARVLLGVTRSMVLDVAREVIPVSTVPVTVADLPAIPEAFITSASRGILPVTRIDERTVGEGRPGPVTRELMACFATLVEREAEPV